MTDRELLEMAAKAAGFERRYADALLGCEVWDTGMDESAFWNPLDDDGDCFRLAVKLDMSVDIEEREASTYAYAGSAPRAYAWEMWHDDKAAATRRAIVRAAATIGEEML